MLLNNSGITFRSRGIQQISAPSTFSSHRGNHAIVIEISDNLFCLEVSAYLLQSYSSNLGIKCHGLGTEHSRDNGKRFKADQFCKKSQSQEPFVSRSRTREGSTFLIHNSWLNSIRTARDQTDSSGNVTECSEEPNHVL